MASNDMEEYMLVPDFLSPTTPPSPPTTTAFTAFGDYLNHSAAKQKSTVVVFVDSLRQHHRDLTLTVTQPSQCDLIGFAQAGKADIEQDLTAGLTIRSYVPAQNQLDGPQGSLKDRLVFAKYNYRWEGRDFLVYIAEGYRDGMMGTQMFTAILRKPDNGETIYSQSAATDALIMAASQWTLELHNEIWIFDQMMWQKSSVLWQSVQDASWDDVILNEEMKQTLKDDIEGFYDERDSYKKFAIPWKRGIIFYGPPGNGKTISIKAMMRSLSERAKPVPSLYVKSFSPFNPEYGIRSVFQKARQVAPCLLIFEDVDALITPSTRSYFLNEVDGLEKNEGVLMLGSTNHLEQLDPGISKRPSRFDRKYLFPLPTLDERTQYCDYWRSKLKSNPEIEFPKRLSKAIAGITDGFSFAYLKEAFVAALLVLLVSRKKNGDGDDDDDLDGLPLWREIQKQVKNLRKEFGSEMTDSSVVAVR